jgi:hypothetical protein
MAAKSGTFGRVELSIRRRPRSCGSQNDFEGGSKRPPAGLLSCRMMQPAEGRVQDIQQHRLTNEREACKAGRLAATHCDRGSRFLSKSCGADKRRVGREPRTAIGKAVHELHILLRRTSKVWKREFL